VSGIKIEPTFGLWARGIQLRRVAARNTLSYDAQLPWNPLPQTWKTDAPQTTDSSQSTRCSAQFLRLLFYLFLPCYDPVPKTFVEKAVARQRSVKQGPQERPTDSDGVGAVISPVIFPDIRET